MVHTYILVIRHVSAGQIDARTSFVLLAASIAPTVMAVYDDRRIPVCQGICCNVHLVQQTNMGGAEPTQDDAEAMPVKIHHMHNRLTTPCQLLPT